MSPCRSTCPPVTWSVYTATSTRRLRFVRGLVVQLATTHGPADWQLVVVTARPDEWSWADWLPHAAAESSIVVDVDRIGDVVADDRKVTLVVTDAPAQLSTRTGPLRRLLDTTRAACIVITPPSATVPAVCDRVLELGVDFLGHWRDVDTLGEPPVHLAGISRSTAERAARRLASLHRSGGPRRAIDRSASRRSPRRPRFGSTPAPSPAGGPPPDPTRGFVPRSGARPTESVDIDLVRDGPHGLIAGTTGAGKSELLRTLVVALAAEVSPDHLSFVLIDFKGGATFDTCARLPHTVGVVTDLDEGLAERALVSLDAEIRRRERLLRGVCADDLAVYRRNATDALARLVVVVDEFATLANELPDFLTALVGIAQRGRSLGVHLLLATQRPAGVVTDDIRANTNLRLALRVHDRSDALDVVGDERPATFPAACRAGRRCGSDPTSWSCSRPRRARGPSVRLPPGS